MSIRLSFAASSLAIFAAQGGFAQVPQVVVDIAPVHSIVAAVMQDIAEPDLLMEATISPHDFALRPSQAAMLQNADLVIWVGAGLSPALAAPVESLAEGAQVVTLLDLPQTRLLDRRQDARFEAHDHGDDHGHDDHGHDDHGHDDHGHDDHKHDDHGHDDHGHDDHGHDEHRHDDHAHDDHGHDHGAIDPHIWLDPQNATIWAVEIAEILATRDADNANAYRANAARFGAQIDELQGQIAADFAATPPVPFIVFHDAYQYFETAFGLAAKGAISLSDASAPSAARLAEIRDVIEDTATACVYAEPQFDPDLVAAVADEAAVGTAVIDPLGAAHPAGPAHYGAMLRDLADAMMGCAR